MPIRLPRTTLPAQPQQPTLGAQPIAGATVAPVGNATEVLADGAQAVAGLAAQLFQQQRDQEVMTRVAELDIQRRKADGDVLAAYSTLQGKDAVEQRGAAMQKLESNSKSLREGIKDATVAQVWARQDAALSLASTQQLDQHFRREDRRWKADTQASRAELLVQDLGRVAFGEGYDPATGRLSAEAERTRSAYLDAVGNLGQLEGWSAERVELERRKADNAAIGRVANTLAEDGRYDEAAALLEASKDRLDPALRADLAGKVRSMSERKRVADDAQALVFDLERGGGSFLEMRDRADQMQAEGKVSTDVYRQALQQLRERSSEVRSETAQRGADLLRQAQQETAQGVVNPATLQQLSETGDLWKFERWREQEGAWQTTDYGFQKLNTATERELLEFKSADEVWKAYRSELSDQHLAVMVARWKEARVALGKAEELTEDDVYALSLNDQVMAHWRRVPGNEMKEKAEGADRISYDAFERKLLMQANVLAREKGQKRPTAATLDEAAKMLNSNAVSVGGVSKPLAALTPAEAQSGKIDLGPLGVADLSGFNAEMLAAAERTLQEKLGTNAKIPDRWIYAQAKATLDEQERDRRQARLDQRTGGFGLATERFRMMLSDPDALDQLQVNVRPYAYSIQGAGSARTVLPKQAFVKEAMRRFGTEIGDAYNIADDEMENYLMRLFASERGRE